MAEYIEREAAIKALKDNVTEMECHIYFGSNLGVPEDEIEDIVNEIPVADVEPVKHGEWVYGEFDIPRCSECGGEIMPHLISNYCPNCGAKMDEKEVQE